MLNRLLRIQEAAYYLSYLLPQQEYKKRGSEIGASFSLCLAIPVITSDRYPEGAFQFH